MATTLVLAGIIDEDYTAELKIYLCNLGTTPQRTEIGDRIAQIILLQYNTPNLHLVKEFEPITMIPEEPKDLVLPELNDDQNIDDINLIEITVNRLDHSVRHLSRIATDYGKCTCTHTPALRHI